MIKTVEGRNTRQLVPDDGIMHRRCQPATKVTTSCRPLSVMCSSSVNLLPVAWWLVSTWDLAALRGMKWAAVTANEYQSAVYLV